MSRLENLLERVRLKVTMGKWGNGDESVCPAYSQIPWDDVLGICIDHKLKDWQIPGPPACEGEGILVGSYFSVDKEQESIYLFHQYLLMAYYNM